MKKDENKQKEAGIGPIFFKKNILLWSLGNEPWIIAERAKPFIDSLTIQTNPMSYVTTFLEFIYRKKNFCCFKSTLTI